MPAEYEPTAENVVCRYANEVRLVLDFLKEPFGDRSPHYITRFGTCPVRFVGAAGWVETGDSGQIEGEPKSLLNSLQNELTRERGLDVASHSRDFFDNIRTTRGFPRGPRRSDAPLSHHLSCGGDCLDFETQVKNRISLRTIYRRSRNEPFPFPAVEEWALRNPDPQPRLLQQKE